MRKAHPKYSKQLPKQSKISPAAQPSLADRSQAPASTIDEYIEKQRGTVNSLTLRSLFRSLPSLSGKSLQAVTEGRYDLVIHIDQLKKIVLSPEVRLAKDPLPRQWAEATLALNYVIKGADIIPDFVQGIGLADDECLVRRVFERNPNLLKPPVVSRSTPGQRHPRTHNKTRIKSPAPRPTAA
jgi:hypothetical protein